MVIGKQDHLKRLTLGLALLFFAILATSEANAQRPDPADNIVIKYLGKKRDPKSRQLVDGYAILDYHKGHAKPDHAGGPKDKGGDGASSCYSVLANGASWPEAEDYRVDLSHSGLPALALEIFESAAVEWNAVAGVEVFGAQSTGASSQTIGVEMDGTNEVDFGPIAEPDVIAVTYVWGIFYGPPSGRVLREWDMRFNSAFTWNTDGNALDMDFENIAQHELGHALGLGHPDNTCTDETMYAYATEGETIKRDLNDGDIAGAQDLY